MIPIPGAPGGAYAKLPSKPPASTLYPRMDYPRHKIGEHHPESEGARLLREAHEDRQRYWFPLQYQGVFRPHPVLLREEPCYRPHCPNPGGRKNVCDGHELLLADEAWQRILWGAVRRRIGRL